MAKNSVMKFVVLVVFFYMTEFFSSLKRADVCVGFFSRLVDGQTKCCILTQFSVQIRRLFTSFTTVIMYFDGGWFSFFHSLILSLSFLCFLSLALCVLAVP